MYPKADEDLINVRDKLGDTARGLNILHGVGSHRKYGFETPKDVEFIGEHAWKVTNMQKFLR